MSENGMQTVERTRNTFDQMFISILCLLLSLSYRLIIITVPTISYTRTAWCTRNLFPFPFIRDAIRTRESRNGTVLIKTRLPRSGEWANVLVVRGEKREACEEVLCT